MKMLLVSLFIFVAGCATYTSPITDKAKADLERPIDCSTAEADIKMLESEKASTTEQTKAGVKMIIPAAAARGILHGDYLDRGMVATGEYNQAIDDKISKIKSECGMQ
ncbi:MAG: hypothetical protein KJ880_06730 [Candidatus Omnitrophica bacterium]|nr:hypothetical protein [Candidatus Omnitrophota bacterium]MBU1868884.1 hypothetical protein [Candidatus Omnitrophota bacterium]